MPRCRLEPWPRPRQGALQNIAPEASIHSAPLRSQYASCNGLCPASRRRCNRLVLALFGAILSHPFGRQPRYLDLVPSRAKAWGRYPINLLICFYVSDSVCPVIHGRWAASVGLWLSDRTWEAIEPRLPKNQPGVRRVDDRRVISGTIPVLRSDVGGRTVHARLQSRDDDLQPVQPLELSHCHAIGPSDNGKDGLWGRSFCSSGSRAFFLVRPHNGPDTNHRWWKIPWQVT